MSLPKAAPYRKSSRTTALVEHLTTKVVPSTYSNPGAFKRSDSETTGIVKRGKKRHIYNPRLTIIKEIH